jgi:hypothetical protein
VAPPWLNARIEMCARKLVILMKIQYIFRRSTMRNMYAKPSDQGSGPVVPRPTNTSASGVLMTMHKAKVTCEKINGPFTPHAARVAPWCFAGQRSDKDLGRYHDRVGHSRQLEPGWRASLRRRRHHRIEHHDYYLADIGQQHNHP